MPHPDEWHGRPEVELYALLDEVKRTEREVVATRDDENNSHAGQQARQHAPLRACSYETYRDTNQDNSALDSLLLPSSEAEVAPHPIGWHARWERGSSWSI